MRRILTWTLVVILALTIAAASAGWVWWMLPRYQAQSVARYGPFRQLLASGALRPQQPPGMLQAGAARVDLTPRRPVPLAGYGDRHGRLSTGVHDRISAKALMLDNGRERLAVLTLDQIGTGLGYKRAVLRQVGPQLGLDEHNLLICASHSHSTPGATAKSALAQLATGRYDSRVEAALTRDMCQALRQAARRLVPARLGWAQARAPQFVANRRGDHFTDPTLSVLRVDNMQGRTIALLADFAAHGTCLSAQNMRISGDWPGYLQRYLERAFPGSIALFANGAQGDQAPRCEPGSRGFAAARSVGEGVGRVAAAAARLVSPTDAVRLAGVALPVRLPITALGLLVGRTTQVQALGIGSTALVGVPGEMAAQVGARLRAQVRRLGFPQVAIVGLANDHIGYIISPHQFRAGGYERSISFFGPGLAGWMSSYCENAAMALAVRMSALPGSHELGNGVRVCGPGRCWRQSGQRLVYLAGNAYELGYQHGALLRREIRRAGATLPRALQAETGLPASLVRLALAAVRRPAYILERYLPPEQILETYGLVRGSGLSYDQALFMQVLLPIAEQPTLPQSLGLGPSCSNLVALAPAARGGVPVYGRNLDWGMGSELCRLASVLVYDPAAGNRFVVVGWSGLVGCLTAMNDRGLCIGEESVASPRDCSLQGVPLFALLRQAVQFCDHLPQAERLITRSPGTCGYHITLLEGNARRAETIERTARYWAIRYPRRGLLLGCIDIRRPQEYAGGALPHPAISKSDHSSDSRYLRLWSLAQASYGEIDEGLMMGMMGDRVDPRTNQLTTSGHAVCNGSTLHSVVWQPTALRFWVAQGRLPAPTGGYVPWSLPGLLRQAPGMLAKPAAGSVPPALPRPSSAPAPPPPRVG